MSLGTVVDEAILSGYGRLLRFRNELEKTGLVSGGRLMFSPREQIDELVSDLIRLRAEEKARKEKEERIKNLKVGDHVLVFGIGEYSGGHFDGKAAFWGDRLASKLTVKWIGPFWVVVGAFGLQWKICRSQIADVLPPINKPRGADRRVETQHILSTGSELHLVKTLEAVSRLRSLSEDELEVLKAAQAKIRKDGTANGFRKGIDRRINGQF